jgi:MFS family permease
VLASAEALLRDGPLGRHRRAARARQGLASGLLNTAAQLGTALGLAVLVAVAAAPSTQVDGFRAAFAADAALAAVATASVVADGLRPQESRRLKRSDAV